MPSSDPPSPAPQSPSPDSPRENESSPESKLDSSPFSVISYYVEVVTESLPVTILMSLFTIWALFSDDIRLAATTKEADEGFMIVISIAFILFLLELFAGCIYKENYLSLPNFTPVPNETFQQKIQRIFNFGSFYFWLDLIATVSLIFEIQWITGDSFETSNQSSLKSARAGRASRAGARAGRIVRLVRMVKLYKYYTDNNATIDESGTGSRTGTGEKSSKRRHPKSPHHSGLLHRKNSDSLAVVSTNPDPMIPPLPPLQGIREESPSANIESQASDPSSLAKAQALEKSSRGSQRSRNSVSNLLTGDEEEEESKVGAAMSDITTKRVIVLVLVMLICIPLMTFTPTDFSPSFSTSVFHQMVKSSLLSSSPSSANATASEQTAITLTAHLLEEDFENLLSLESNDIHYLYHKEKLSSLRSSEIDIYEFSNTLTLPNGDLKKLNTVAKFSIRHITTSSALYGIYLTLFILFLLVVGTYYFSSDVNTLVIIPIEKMVSLVREISKNPLGVEYTMLGEEDGFLEGMETTILLQTINKIGGLMRVGFGEAGASVIAKNLSGSGGGSGGNKLNLMGSGTLIKSIFGFCDVRNFTDTTECLQEEVMLFVNRIAHILHGIVVQCSGSANKNIGDAFLLTWKLEEGLTSKEISYLADQALVAFLKAFIELTRYQDFICNFSVQATNRLYKRFPGYKVRIGSGLHVGWAVEGALGSPLKIDVTYLSPHVGLSEYLESSTKLYGVPLLLSESFYKLLTPSAAKYCRQIDRIKVTTTDEMEPFGLFAYDCDVNLEYALSETEQSLQRAQKNKRRLIDTRKSAMVSGSVSLARGGGGGGRIGNVSGSGAISGSMQLQSVANLRHQHSNASQSGSGEGHSSSRGGKGSNSASGSGVSGETHQREVADEKEQKPTVVIPRYLETIWESDGDLIRLRHLVNDNFRKLWKEGMVAYIKGDWTKAVAIFKETLRSSEGEDGPSKFLVSFMEEYGGIAPRDWEGYREG